MLKFHRETKQLPVYELTVAKSGLKSAFESRQLHSLHSTHRRLLRAIPTHLLRSTDLEWTVSTGS